MLDTHGALVASLDEIIGLSVEGWGWMPVAEIGEGADLPPPADEDESVATEADALPGPANSAEISGQGLLAQAAAEDSFRFDFFPAGAAEEQAIVPAATEGVTLDQLDLAALLAARETLSFVAEWDFGVVAVQVRAIESTSPEGTAGQGFEVVLSAVGSPAFNDAVL